MSILVVESDDAIRRSLHRRLVAASPGWRIREAASEEEAVAAAQAQPPRVILVDIADPDMDGVKTVRGIRDAAPQSAVVALVMRDDEAYCRDLASAGASTSLLIWRIDAELLPTIRALLPDEFENGTTVPC
jgi:two-component system OmpR family response regulator